MKRIGLTLLLVLAIATLIGVVRYLPTPDHTVFWDVLYDTGHIPVFGLTTVFLLFGGALLFANRYLLRQYIGAMLLSLFIGLAVEFWQQFLADRSAELLDVLNDLIGIVGFAMLYAIVDDRIPTPRQGWTKRFGLFLGAVVLLLLGFVPLFKTCSLYQERRAALPTLLEYRWTWYEKFFYLDATDLEIISPPDEWPSAHRRRVIGKLILKPAFYSGIVVHEPHPNWSAYSSLQLDVLYAEDTERQFVLRVHDREHDNDPKDRYRHSFMVQPGFQTIRVPIAEIESGPTHRKLDLKHISGMSLYTPGLKQSKTLYLGNVRLVE